MARVFAASALLLLTAIWLFSGRGGFGVPNQWLLTPNARPWPWGAWLLPIGVLLIFGGAAALSIYDRFKRAKSDKEKRNSTLTALFCLAILLFLWPWALLGPGAINQAVKPGAPQRITLEGRFNIIAALWSDVATEYFGVAYQVNAPRQFGREYASRWQKPPSPFQAHVATHPPGAVLFFYGLRRTYEALPPLQTTFERLATTSTGESLNQIYQGASLLRASASRGAGAGEAPPLPVSAIGNALWTACILGLSLVLTIPAVYGLASIGTEGDQAEARGLFAVALWVLAPTVNLFAFTLDAPVAAGGVWALFIVARALHSPTAKNSRLWMIAAGVTLALTSFLSIGALAVGLIIVLALFFFHRAQFWPRVLELGVAFLVVWVVLALMFAFNPFTIVQNALATHRFATLSNRSWAPWTVVNLLVWAMFIGYALLVCLFHREKPTFAGATIGVAALCAMILLSLSGNVRGEVERLWLFLAAPIAIWAAFAHLSPRARGLLLSIQAIQTLIMAATLGPLVRP